MNSRQKAPKDLRHFAIQTTEDGIGDIHFSVTGKGELAATGSANPHEMASFHQPQQRMFHGRCLAILRPTSGKGTITLEARGEKLRSATVTVDVGA